MPTIATITPEGFAWYASKEGAGLDAVISTVKFLDSGDVEVHSAAVTAVGRVNNDLVVYSIELAEAVGSFTFDKIEWYSNDASPVKVLTDAMGQDIVKTADLFSWVHNTLVPYGNVATIANITIDAASWQLNFEGHFRNIESDARAAAARMMGRFAALNSALLVTAPAPTIADALDVVGSWALSGGSGSITVDGADKMEGAASLEVAGHVADAEFSLDFGAPVDWSANNGVVGRAQSAGGATNILFFLEDGSGNRNEWNIVAQTTFTEHEIDMTAPDVNGGTDYTDVKIMGWGGLDSGTVYNFDAIERLRFTDYSLTAGDAFLEGVFLEPVVTQYSDHPLDWNGDAVTVPTALAPPGGGTRTDGVYLDMYLLPGADGPVAILALIVDDAAQADYVDGAGYQHWVEKLCDIERDTGERITTAMLTDARRNVLFNAADGLAFAMEALKVNTITEATTDAGVTLEGSLLKDGGIFPGAAPSPPAANTLYRENIMGARINFNGNGTIAINGSFNVASITDDGVGQYTVTWDRDFADANYTTTTSQGMAANHDVTKIDAITAGSVGVETKATDGSLVDATMVGIMAMGDQ